MAQPTADTATYRHPEALATAGWLADHLDDPTIRVVDARFTVRAGTDGTLEAVSEHDAYRKAHIPGAVFVDVMSDLSDPDDPVVVVSPERFENLMRRLGIGDETTVVIYDEHGGTWAARLWWALRYYGHDAVMLLDGGFTRWQAAGFPLDSGVPSPSPATFTARVRPEFRVDADQVAQAIGRDDVCIVDALPEIFFTGGARLYPHHRAGHIPSAYNVPAPSHLDPATHQLLPAADLARLWEPVGLQPTRRVITYCGGGVFGAYNLFVLHVLGHENAALYDASWMEWGADPSRPVETGPRAATQDQPTNPERQ
ncbi:sulfurtransferase [Mycobacterium sp.]|uniref:sulfurtransferase n=1 Tax=Mycobacterium sp. TaxID=1785 RepID=UPI0026015EC2|nr:sulfurtransferase [Mycobacterium sp.]